MQTVSRKFLPIPRFLELISRLAATLLILTCAGALTPARADGVGSLSIAQTGHFFVGGKYADTKDGPVLAGQAYVEYYIPTDRTHRYPIVMIEGCCLAGAGYMGTPDGRDGWGQYFLSKGYAVYIMDQVGRGRSPYVEAVYGPKSIRSPKSVERDFIAYEKYNLFPQAKLHTQWPGSGTVGDPTFDQFMAETLPMIGDAKVREAVNRDATIAFAGPDRPRNSDAAFAVRRSGVARGGCAATTRQSAADDRGGHLVILRGEACRAAALV